MELTLKWRFKIERKGVPHTGNPAVYSRAGERLFKITLAGTNAKAKENENWFKKLALKKWWCVGENKLRSAPRAPRRSRPWGDGGTLNPYGSFSNSFNPSNPQLVQTN
jgi:hypothetical protein